MSEEKINDFKNQTESNSKVQIDDEAASEISGGIMMGPYPFYCSNCGKTTMHNASRCTVCGTVN